MLHEHIGHASGGGQMFEHWVKALVHQQPPIPTMEMSVWKAEGRRDFRGRIHGILAL